MCVVGIAHDDESAYRVPVGCAHVYAAYVLQCAMCVRQIIYGQSSGVIKHKMRMYNLRVY